MALRGAKPTYVKKRLKAFFYGDTSTGKTWTAMQFPTPYIIDTEDGSDNDKYVDIQLKNGAYVFYSSDYQEIVKEVKSLLSEKHDFKTLVIDPLTNAFYDLLAVCAKKTGTAHGVHYVEANNQMRLLCQLLVRLDMNVIITSHTKVDYNKDHVVIGQTFDCYKKLEFLFDLVIETKKIAGELVGVVKKTRIDGFKDGEQFPLDYDLFVKKYASPILEKEVTLVELANDEQLKEIALLISDLNIDESTIQKWLNKAKSSDFTQMTSQDIQKCIDYLSEKMKAEDVPQ